ncbi:Carbohydrate binding domain protein [uncultured archaeon]|nr:Carbohydrate binding domain protein [uncultured archaeon]
MLEKKFLRINIGWIKYTGLICILLLAVYPGPSSAAPVNIILNPGFESGTTYWSFYTDGSGSFLNDVPGVASSHAGHIKIIKPGTNVQLFQKGLVLLPDTLYQLNFKAYSNTGHDLSISLMKHGSPYTKYGLSNYVVNLGTTWKDYSIQFKSSGFSGTVTDARLMFWLAPYDASEDQYFFDDVTLTPASVTPPTTGTPTITTQPSGQTVAVGYTATFGVTATGTAPLSYQWQKNSVNILGATGATYTTKPTTLSDNGAIFRVIISNSLGSVTSNGAKLTVSSTPPSNKQLVVLDVNYQHSTTITKIPPLNAISGMSASFFNFPSYVPDNLISPIDYAHGTVYQRLQVFTKPSTKTVKYQICFFQDTITQPKHACTNRDLLAFNKTGTYYASQPLSNIYQSDHIDWGRKLLIIMLDMTDKNGVLIDSRPVYNMGKIWDGSPNLALYYPMNVRYTAIIVPKGGGAPVWP